MITCSSGCTPQPCNNYNNILKNQEIKKNLVKYKLLLKILEFLMSKSLEIKKEISKFLTNLS